MDKLRRVELRGRKFDVEDGGRAWSCAYVGIDGSNQKRREVKFSQHSCGYLVFGIRCDGVNFTYYQHELVALAFIGVRPEGFDVHHDDEDKSNNFSGNLGYIEHSEHARSHALSMGLGR
jgi:hypothetical protein